MRFTIEAGELARVVETAGRGAARRTAVKVLGGLRLEASGGALAVCGTDMTVAVSARAKYRPAGGRGKSGDRVVVAGPAAEIVRAVKTLEGDVAVESDGTRLRFTAGRTVLAFELYETGDFPRVAGAGEALGSFPADRLLGLFESVRRAYSRDESRPVLTGVHLEHKAGALTLAATDSYRLAVDAMPSGLEGDWAAIVPGDGLALLAKLARRSERIQVAQGDGGLCFKVDDVSVWLRTIDGTFPNWRQLLPDYAGGADRVTFDRLAALKALKRIVAVQREQAVVVLAAAPGAPLAFRLDQHAAASVRDAIDADVQLPEPLVIGFHPEFLVDALEAVDGERVTMTAVSGLRPAVFRGATESPWHLLMPIRIAESTPNAKPAAAAA